MSLIPIQSVSDIITNSSTEVFVADITDVLLENIKEFSDKRDVILFKTYDDIFNYLESQSFYADDLEEYLRKYWENQNFCFDYGSVFLDQYTIDFFVEKVGKTIEQVWDFYKDVYKPLLGKAFYTYSDDCYTPDDIDIIESNFEFVTRH